METNLINGINSLEELNNAPLVVLTKSGKYWYKGKRIEHENLPKNSVVWNAAISYNRVAVFPYEKDGVKGVECGIYSSPTWKTLGARDTETYTTYGQLRNYCANKYTEVAVVGNTWKPLDFCDECDDEGFQTITQKNHPQFRGATANFVDIRNDSWETSKVTQQICKDGGVVDIDSDTGHVRVVISVSYMLQLLRHPLNIVRFKKRLENRKNKLSSVLDVCKEQSIPRDGFRIFENDKDVFMMSFGKNTKGVIVSKKTGDQSVVSNCDFSTQSVRFWEILGYDKFQDIYEWRDNKSELIDELTNNVSQFCDEIQAHWDTLMKVEHLKYVLPSFKSLLDKSLVNSLSQEEKASKVSRLYRRLLMIFVPKYYQDLTFEQSVKEKGASPLIDPLNNWWRCNLENYYITSYHFLGTKQKINKKAKTPYEQVGLSKKQYYALKSLLCLRTNQDINLGACISSRSAAEDYLNDMLVGYRGDPAPFWSAVSTDNWVFLMEFVNFLLKNKVRTWSLRNWHGKNPTESVDEWVQRILRWAKKLKTYPFVGNTYFDYVGQVRELQTRYPDYEDVEWDMFPSTRDLLITLHDRATMCLQQEIQKERNKNILQQEDAYVKIKKALSSKLEWENEKYQVILPEKLVDLVKEGAALSHCVGSYTGSVSANREVICFLRKKEEADKPWVTIDLVPTDGNTYKASEATAFEIRQAHGKHNSQPVNIEGAYQALKDWANSVGCVNPSSVAAAYGVVGHI